MTNELVGGIHFVRVLIPAEAVGKKTMTALWIASGTPDQALAAVTAKIPTSWKAEVAPELPVTKENAERANCAPAMPWSGVRSVAKTPKRPRDPAQLAKFIVDVATGEVEDREPTPEEQGKSAAAAELGRKGGNARAVSMSAKKRKDIAKKAADKRWAKKPVPAE